MHRGRAEGEAPVFRQRLAPAVFAGEETAAEGTPGYERHAVLLRNRHQLALDAPVEQVVGRLLTHESGEVLLLRYPERLHELVEELSEEDALDLLDFLQMADDPDELTPEELAELEEIDAAMERGEYITLEDLRASLPAE